MVVGSAVNKRRVKGLFESYFRCSVYIWMCLCICLCVSHTAFSGNTLQEIKWKELAKGLSMTTISVSSMSWTGSDSITVIRIAADSWQFQPHYFKENKDRKRKSAHNWLESTNTNIVINAGQYDTNYKHLGWFIRDRKNMGSSLHPIWKGLFVCQPKASNTEPFMTIIDEEKTPQTIELFPYTNAVQSLMLFDETGKIRVNKSDKFARRCIVSVGTDGFIYIFLTEGEVTLWNIAEFLRCHPLNLDKAMSMDGGAQAQLSLKTDKFELNMPNFQMVLPCVICFKPVSNHQK